MTRTIPPKNGNNDTNDKKEKVMCSAITASTGKPCKIKVWNDSKYCYHHHPDNKKKKSEWSKGNNGGRPRIQAYRSSESNERYDKKKKIDFDLVDRLCHIQCTGEEIAATIGVAYSTLMEATERVHNISFQGYHAIKREGGKSSLRRAQWKKATEEGNTTMQIWLGKQCLGQKDKQTHEHTGDGGGPIKTESKIDLSILSDEELSSLERIARKTIPSDITK